MSTCGNMEFLQGGTIQNTTVVGADITSSTVTASEITASTLSNITGIDETTIRTIVTGIMALDENTKKNLLESLGFSFNTAAAPATNVEAGLPTTMYGDRSALLGKPVGWISVDGNVVPHY